MKCLPTATLLLLLATAAASFVEEQQQLDLRFLLPFRTEFYVKLFSGGGGLSSPVQQWYLSNKLIVFTEKFKGKCYVFQVPAE